MKKEFNISTSTGDVKVTTGHLALLSAGAVQLRKGETEVLVTADINDGRSSGDFFPLTVEYLERYYATGNMSGSRFNKREGFPNESAIIAAREVDHTIRPLFPKYFRKPVNVIVTLLTHDGENDPHQLTVIGASLSVLLAGIPFAGPVSSVILGVEENGEVVMNPIKPEAELKGKFSVSVADGKLMNIEGVGREVSNEEMDKVLDFAVSESEKINAQQKEFLNLFEIKKIEYSDDLINQELVSTILEQDRQTIIDLMYGGDIKVRSEKGAEVMNLMQEKYVTEEVESFEFENAWEYAVRKLMRERVMKEEVRLSGRKLDEIRELSAEVDTIKGVHASALFTRGYTQSLSITTIGSTRKSEAFDDLNDKEASKPFMHHYNFPPFSTGEAGRVRYKPGRREIGHGAIGENGLKYIIANQEDFPYTVRVVSEIMSSNGSTSMAATCAASMSLMAAGVPMKSAVAGIGVGLISDENDYKLILDIEGAEDFYGDMDFKVTGTKDGLTAIQFETKLQGVDINIIKEAFRMSHKGRLHVLEVMNAAIDKSREELPENAPRVQVIKIPTDNIGELIGPGGKNIKGIIEKSKQFGSEAADIDINDDGRVNVTTANAAQMEYLVSTINLVANGPEIGEIYDAVVDSIVDFGAFIKIGDSISGLVHISEIAPERVNNVSDYLKVGQEIKVKMIENKGGKYGFSIKKLNS